MIPTNDPLDSHADGGAASPRVVPQSGMPSSYDPGMSLRAYIATHIAAGLSAKFGDDRLVPEVAVAQADLLIMELSK